jgi:hypothetical protein
MMNTRCSKHVEDTKNWIKTLIWKVCICWFTLHKQVISVYMYMCVCVYTHTHTHTHTLLRGCWKICMYVTLIFSVLYERMSYHFPVFPLLLLATLFRHFALCGFSRKQTSPSFAVFQKLHLLIIRINKNSRKSIEKESRKSYFLLTQPARLKWRQ